MFEGYEERYIKMRKQVKLARNETYSQYFHSMMHEIAEFINEKVPDGVELEVNCDNERWKLRVTHPYKAGLKSVGTSLARKKVD